MTTELKPCPFCGGNVKLEQTLNKKGWGVVCRSGKGLGGTCSIEQVPSVTKDAAIERWNTRAVPDVPELVRYRMEGCEDTYYENGHLQHDGIYVNEVEDATGTYVLASEAERIIADLVKENERLKDSRSDAPIGGDLAYGLIHRAEADEAKLAEIEKQVPVGYYNGKLDYGVGGSSVIGIDKTTKNGLIFPIGAHPVADREPTARQALQAIADLPSGKNEDVMSGHEDAYRIVEKLFKTPPEINCSTADREVETIERCAMVLDMMHNNLANNTDYDDRRAILAIAAKNLRALSGKEPA